ncbi:hypothetical protein TMatcc_002903 [Talaromyces marneffei ATCC 18224]|uniref:RING-type E3 ubiquitin transferase n=1 Tax=Talaromyces marneffei PM1 TaxID=1077442 RepID=A0A093VXX9_TALMA|nr:uncharacterized protein EYB26_002015 [Talaromyces marneffei]KAE8555640.1 hypothetical protein EYB25_000338 [Talaromyces marneffei]QGA14362.1 hypothetical protein EYB26_002015 [Talaromyces marneffei]
MPERGEDVLCYHCNNVFPKDEFGLMCPRCGSDFTEIIEGSAEEQHPTEEYNSRASSPPFPSSLSPRPPQSPQSPRSARYDAENPFFNHNPWAETNDDEPQRFGSPPRVSRHQYRSPDGRITFTSTTFTTGMGGRVRSPPSPDPYGGEPLLRTVGSIFQELTGVYNTQNRNGPPPDREDPWETPGTTRGANLHGGLWPRDTDSPQPPTVPLASLNDIFDLLRTDTAGDGFDRPRGGIHIMGATGMGPMHPLSLLATILGGGRIGDAVYSQEELDRVISQLVDQNMNQGAPPAAETAIQSLPKKVVDQEMLGVEGRAECSICMDPVELGSEVTELPCKHWFHGDCIEMWLKQHNTCPHCRRPIDQGENAPGTRNNPVVIPSSPPQSPPRRRSSAFGYESNRDYSGSPYRSHGHRTSSGSSFNNNHRTSPHHTASAPPEERREQSSQDQPENQSQSSGGGVAGWLRSHFGGS